MVLRAVDADEHAVRQHRPARLLRAAVEALGVARARSEGVQLRVDLLVDRAGGVLHGLSLTLRLLPDVLALHGQEVRHGVSDPFLCERLVFDDGALSWRTTPESEFEDILGGQRQPLKIAA